MNAPRPEGKAEKRASNHERGWKAPNSAPDALAALRGESSAFRILRDIRGSAVDSSVIVRSARLVNSLLCRSTEGLVKTFEACNPAYTYSNSFNPRRVLSKPAEPVGNNGFDNEHADLILSVGMNLCSPQGYSYKIVDLLGQGTFGQVVKCIREDTGDIVAVKIVKNLPAYFHQARVEVGILQMLNSRCEADKDRIVKLLDYFVYEKHLCLVFELLGINLYELIRHNHYKGLSINLLRLFVRQILEALIVLREANVVHCDVKPENILLKSLNSGELKLIDYGSACFHNRTVYSYIQSRFYRSPEVILGHPYGTEIDMWSLGCVAAELFFGLPLFPGTSEYDMLLRITQLLGPMPDTFLERCSKLDQYFKFNDSSSSEGLLPKRFVLVSEEEFETRHKVKYLPGKRYFKQASLREIISSYPFKRNMLDEDIEKEKINRECLLDFLLGVLRFDPETRWTPKQAAAHPFVSGQKYTGPYVPLPETRPTHYSVSQGIGIPGVQANSMAAPMAGAIHNFASHMLGVSPISNFGHAGSEIGMQYASDPMGMANQAFILAANQHQLRAGASFVKDTHQAFQASYSGGTAFHQHAGTSVPSTGFYQGVSQQGLKVVGGHGSAQEMSGHVPMRREMSLPTGLAGMQNPGLIHQSLSSSINSGIGSPQMHSTMVAAAAAAAVAMAATNQQHFKPHTPPSPRRRAARLADASSFPYPHVPSRLSIGSGSAGNGMLAAEAERSDTPPGSLADWNPMFTEEALLTQHSPPGKISGGSYIRSPPGVNGHSCFSESGGAILAHETNSRSQETIPVARHGALDPFDPSCERPRKDKHPRH